MPSREKKIEESVEPKTINERKSKLFSENERVLQDFIFQKIVAAIEAGWNKIDTENKERVLSALQELLSGIKEYHESYRKLKGVSSYKLSDTASMESIKRYQGDVADADRREHEIHKKFLDSVNILSRRMKEVGLDNSWRADELIFPQPDDNEANMQKVKRWAFQVFNK